MRVCTIVTTSQWAHLRVLAASVAKHVPGATVTALVIDAEAHASSYEPFTVLLPDDVGLKRLDFHRMACMYDAAELSAALKPRLLARFPSDEPLVYLEPETEAFAARTEEFSAISSCRHVDARTINGNGSQLLHLLHHVDCASGVHEDDVATELCSRYAERLRWAGHWSYSRIPYVFGVTAAGLKIDGCMRRLYRRESAGTSLLPDPFDAESAEAFEGWLREPIGTGGVSRYLRALYDERPELREAFPKIDGHDATRYMAWARARGSVDLGIPAQLLDDARTDACTGVNVMGHLTAENGVGEAARLLISTLDSIGIPVQVAPDRETQTFPAVALSPEQFGPPVHATDIVCVNADGTADFLATAEDGPRSAADIRTIGVWAWEVEPFPEWMAHAAEALDEIWVWSEHAAHAVRRRVRRPVHVFPLPMLAPPEDTIGTPPDLPDGFLFLACFDFGSVFERKNPIAVIDAFSKAFPEGSGPQLVIKTVRGSRYPEKLEELQRAASRRSDVHVMDVYLARADHWALMTACDAYVSLHRAEGFGLLMAEAMVLGKPVLATGYSGNLEFMDETNSYLVPYEIAWIPPGCDPYPAGGVWAEPDVDAAADIMRRIVSDPDEAKVRGARAAADIARLHGPHAREVFLKERLREAPQPLSSTGSDDQDSSFAMLEQAAQVLRRGPDVDSPTGYGAISKLWRRIVMRMLRHLTEHVDGMFGLHLDALKQLESELAIERGSTFVLKGRVRELEARLERGDEPSPEATSEHPVEVKREVPSHANGNGHKVVPMKRRAAER